MAPVLSPYQPQEVWDQQRSWQHYYPDKYSPLPTPPGCHPPVSWGWWKNQKKVSLKTLCDIVSPRALLCKVWIRRGRGSPVHRGPRLSSVAVVSSAGSSEQGLGGGRGTWDAHQRGCQKQAVDACYWGALKPVPFQLKFSAIQTCLQLEFLGSFCKYLCLGSGSWKSMVVGRPHCWCIGHQSSAPGEAPRPAAPLQGPAAVNVPWEWLQVPLPEGCPGRLRCSLPACEGSEMLAPEPQACRGSCVPLLPRPPTSSIAHFCSLFSALSCVPLLTGSSGNSSSRTT